jgi:hypothetical protein
VEAVNRQSVQNGQLPKRRRGRKKLREAVVA